MIDMIFLSVAVIFAALGICDFLHTVKSAFLFPGVKTESVCIVFLREEYALCQLRFFAAKLRWYGSEYCDKIIAVTDGLSETAASSCERFCYGANIYLCRFGELSEKLNCLIGEADEGKRNA